MYSYIKIGKILKPYKKDGEILVDIEPHFWQDLSNCRAVFLKVNGLEVPFFIENVELDKDGSILKLEEFSSREGTIPLNGTTIFLREEDVKTDLRSVPDKNNMDLWVDYSIYDSNSTLKFEILEILQMPQQLMAVVMQKDKEILIPLVEDLIETVDANKKTITMNLPEGLLDV